MTRPVSVSIVGWFQTIGGVLTLFTVPIVLTSRLTLTTLQTFDASPVGVALVSLVASALNLTTGIFILRGNRLGRQIYLIATPLLSIVSLFLYHFRMAQFYLFGLVVFAGFAFILTRKDANEFFRSPENEDVSAAQKDVPT